MQDGLSWCASRPQSSPKHLSVATGDIARVVMNYARLKGFTHATFHVLLWLAPRASCLLVGLCPLPISLSAAGHPAQDQYLTWAVEQVRHRGAHLDVGV